jgi:hypothetical protein
VAHRQAPVSRVIDTPEFTVITPGKAPKPLPSLPKVVVTGNMTEDRLAGLKAFERISQAFATGLDQSEPQAYGQLLRDLMDNSSLLVSGGLMSAKEVLDKLEDLQAHIKKGGHGGHSAIDIFHSWLNAEGADAAADSAD